MLVNWMPPLSMEGFPFLEPPVNTLMPSSCQLLPVLLLPVVKVLPRNIKVLWVALVATISNGTLITLKHVDYSIKGNLQVIELAAWVGTIQPYNPSSLNADTHFIPEPSAVEFVTVPPLIEWLDVPDAKVCAIQRDEAAASIGM